MGASDETGMRPRRAGKNAEMMRVLRADAKKRPGLTRIAWHSASGVTTIELGPDGNPVIDAEDAPKQLESLVGGPKEER